METLRCRVWKHSSTCRYRKAYCGISKVPTHVFNPHLCQYECHDGHVSAPLSFGGEWKHSFICNIIVLHRNSPYRKQGNFSHPLTSGFLLPFFLESACIWAGSAGGCSEGAEGQPCKALSLWQHYLLRCVQQQLVLWQAATLQIFFYCGYREKILNSDGFGWSHIGRSPVFPLLSPPGGVHLRKVLSLYKGHRLCSSD